MSAQLDPISTTFFILESGFGYNLNQTMTVRSRRRLEKTRLKTALRLTVDRHPILGSHVAVDTAQDRFRCRWERLPEAAELPLTWNILSHADFTLETHLDNIEYNQHNFPLNCSEEAPFRLYIQDCGDSGTHLQLVLSHAAGDGKSLLLFFRELFEHYLAEESGSAAGKPLPHVPADWETLFNVPTSPFLRNMAARSMQAENRRRFFHRLPCFGDERDWPIMLARHQHKGVFKSISEVLQPFPRYRFDRPRPQEQFGHIGRFKHRLSGADLSALRSAAKNHRLAATDLITLAFVLTQQDLARQAGEPVKPVQISLPLDLRTHAKHPFIRQSLGNLVSGISFRLNPDSNRRTDVLKTLKEITEQKFNGIRNWHQSVQKILTIQLTQQNISYECMQSFLHNFSSDRRTTAVSHLGNPSSLLSPDIQQRIGVERIEVGSVSIASPEIQTLEHEDYLFISYCYLRSMTTDAAMAQVVELFKRRLAHLVNELSEPEK